MGFYISKIGETKLNEYIGSQTIYSCADNGAFDSKVNEELEALLNKDESIVAIVDKNGVTNFLNILASGNVTGRDLDLLSKTVNFSYKEGFMIRK